MAQLNDKELMKAAYANTHYAGELVSDLWEEIKKTGVVNHKAVNDLLVTLRDAVCAMQALEQRAAGNPPPKCGD